MATIKLIRVKCKNLSTKEDLWRLGVKSIGNVSAEDFVKHASEHCDVKIGTLRASLAAFVDSAKLFLSMGHGVQLGDLGTLQLSVTSKATKLEKDLTAKNLTGVNVNLRPIGDLAKEIKNFKFSVVGAVDEQDDDNTGTIDPGSNQQQATTYTALFEFHDGTRQEVTGAEGSALAAPANTPGYVWDSAVPATMPAEDTSYTEVADTRPTHTVTYRDADMEEFDVQTVHEGAPIIPPTPPTGYHWVDVPAVMPSNDINIRCAANA